MGTGFWGLPICAFASTDAGLAWLVFRGLRAYQYLIRIDAPSSMQHAIPVKCLVRLNVMLLGKMGLIMKFAEICLSFYPSSHAVHL